MIYFIKEYATSQNFYSFDSDGGVYYSKSLNEYLLVKSNNRGTLMIETEKFASESMKELLEKNNLKNDNNDFYGNLDAMPFNDNIIKYLNLEKLVNGKTLTATILSTLLDMFDDELGILRLYAYKHIDGKIGSSPKFDNVAFLSGTLTNFYFKYKTKTIISWHYNNYSLIDLFNPNRLSKMACKVAVVEDGKKSIVTDYKGFENSFLVNAGMIKDHDIEELKILLSDECIYITNDEVKNIFKLN